MRSCLSLLLVSVLCAACAPVRQPPPPEPSPAENAALPDRVNLYYFYEELCGVCEGDVGEFYAIAGEQLAEIGETYPYALHTINVYLRENRSLYQQALAGLGLEGQPPELPFMAAGGRVFQGHETIAKNFREAFLTAGEDLFVNRGEYKPLERKTGAELFDGYRIVPGHRTLVYFYRITCEECGAVKPLIDGLPETAAVKEGQAPLDIIRINTRSGNNGERIAAFFDHYQVPNEDRMVPIVFLEDRYLAGYKTIAAELGRRLEEPPRSNLLEGLLSF
jgi:hypothetical protein